MWPLECTQGFSKICPSDLVFHWTWPIFKIVAEVNVVNILTKFHGYQTENVTFRAYTRFFYDLTKWPIFFIRHDPFSIKSEISLRQLLWPRFISIGLKMWSLERTQDFSRIWPSDLVFTWHDPFSNSSKISLGQTFWPSFMCIKLKMWPLQCTQDFS